MGIERRTECHEAAADDRRGLVTPGSLKIGEQRFSARNVCLPVSNKAFDSLEFLHVGNNARRRKQLPGMKRS
jgi:hypothetical protein